MNDLVVERGGNTVLSGVALSLGTGQRIVIRGANGSGKTTLLLAILGRLPLSRGTLRISGFPMGSREWKQHRRNVAWVPQEGVLHRFPISAGEVVAAGTAGRRLSRSDRRQRVEHAMVVTGCRDLRDSCYHRLSAGQRRRISLARCLAQDAKVLLLDEPAAYLDADSRQRLRRMLDDLADQGRAVIAVTHESDVFTGTSWTDRHLEGGVLC